MCPVPDGHMTSVVKATEWTDESVMSLGAEVSEKTAKLNVSGEQMEGNSGAETKAR